MLGIRDILVRDPYLWLKDPDPGGPNPSGPGSPTLEGWVGLDLYFSTTDDVTKHALGGIQEVR